MVGRCKYPSHTSWRWYGALGISVCDRWLRFENFLSDMGQPPFPKASIERRNNAGNYSPENCFWATPKQQQRNRKNTLWLSLNGRKQSAAAWAEELGLDQSTLFARKASGWSDERALSEPLHGATILTCNGISLTRQEWAERTGIKPGTIWYRLNQGWPIEKAVGLQKGIV